MALSHETLHRMLKVPDGHRIRNIYVNNDIDSVMVVVEGPSMREVAEYCQPPMVMTSVQGVENDEGYTLAWRVDWPDGRDGHDDGA